MNSPMLGDHFNECRGGECDATRLVTDERGVVQVLYAIDVSFTGSPVRYTTALCEPCLQTFVRRNFGKIQSLQRVCRVNLSRAKRAAQGRVRFTGEHGVANGTVG